MLRTTFLLLALLLACAARTARAEDEVFVLDNGSTFRGHVIRAKEGALEIQLSGFGRHATVTLAEARIVTRFVPVDTSSRMTKARLPDADWTADSKKAEPEAAGVVEEETQVVTPMLPAEEPAARDEGFFHRLARVTVLAMPPETAGRIALAGLLFVALLMLVMLGCRLAEIENLDLGRASIMTAVMGVFLGADLLLHDVLLRADVATWVLPAQAFLWIAVAVPVLRCGLARSILLFAFVMFSLAVLLFTAGAILVTY